MGCKLSSANCSFAHGKNDLRVTPFFEQVRGKEDQHLDRRRKGKSASKSAPEGLLVPTPFDLASQAAPSASMLPMPFNLACQPKTFRSKAKEYQRKDGDLEPMKVDFGLSLGGIEGKLCREGILAPPSFSSN